MSEEKVKGGSNGQEDNNMFVTPLDWVDTMNRMLKKININDIEFGFEMIEYSVERKVCKLFLFKDKKIKIETEVLDIK